jgi:hypothetical protein
MEHALLEGSDSLQVSCILAFLELRPLSTLANSCWIADISDRIEHDLLVCILQLVPRIRSCGDSHYWPAAPPDMHERGKVPT